MEHVFIQPTPVREIPLIGTDDCSIVVFTEPIKPSSIGFKHRCTSWEDRAEPDGMFRKVVAPRLTKHTVTGSDDSLTIRASIMCPDCGLHGYVTNGVWHLA